MNKGLSSLQLQKCIGENDWAAARSFRNTYFFDPQGIEDPYTWTFEHPNYCHYILYEKDVPVGYAHIQIWPDSRAAIRIIVVSYEHRDRGLGKHMLERIEEELHTEGIKSIHTESTPEAVNFYMRLNYQPMPFNDPDGYESGPNDIALGKEF